MIAELISVGTELLMGQILNTNAQYLARELAPLGVNVYHQVTVGDNHGRLKDAIETALKRADILILSGGLGPTADDITKTVVAQVMSLAMTHFKEAEETLRARFASQRREMTQNNLRQTVYPEGSRLLRNDAGTAQGCIVEKDGKAAILLPGPPRELEPMFEREVKQYLLERSGHRLYSRELRIFGMGESAVEDRIKHLLENQTNPTIAPYAKTGEVTLRVTARCGDDAEGERIVEPVVDAIVSLVGADLVYSTVGETMPEVVKKLLEENNLTVSAAESCTGGMLASALVDVPGSSASFMEGAVTYSDGAKIKRLGVSNTVLRKHGAVSEDCARAMALGMCRTSGTDYALATTGIAGPGGGTPEKPVGTIYVALSDGKRTRVNRLLLVGDRARIRNLTVLHALDMLRRELLGNTI